MKLKNFPSDGTVTFTELPKLNINQAMAMIMGQVESIKKDKTNEQQKFKYRGIDDVMNALHEAFAEAGVFLTTDVLERSEIERTNRSGGALFYVTQKITFTFHAPDGSSVSSTIYGTAMDSGDKADNKCLSIALKYALLQAFLIPTEDMQEPDAQVHEVKPKQQAAAKPATPPPAKPAEKKPIPADRMQKLSDYINANGPTPAVLHAVNQAREIFTFNPDQERYLADLLDEHKLEVIAPSNNQLL